MQYLINTGVIGWNPYRSEKNNPLQRVKLDGLKDSMIKSRNESNEDGLWKTGLGLVLFHVKGDGTLKPFTSEEVADFCDTLTPGQLITAMPDGVEARLYAGHHRLGAALELDIDTIPVVFEYMTLREVQLRYILENASEYDANLQVMVENVSQTISIAENMLRSCSDYDDFIDSFGAEGLKMVPKKRGWGQIVKPDGSVNVGSPQIHALLGTEVSIKAIQGVMNILLAEADGLVHRSDVYDFPSPKMAGEYIKIVKHIDESMGGIPPYLKQYYKDYLRAAITGGLLITESERIRQNIDDDELREKNKDKWAAAVADAKENGSRVTLNKLSSISSHVTRELKKQDEDGNPTGSPEINIPATLNGMAVVKFKLEKALAKEDHCGYTVYQIQEAGKGDGIEGLTDVEPVLAVVGTIIADIEKKQKEADAKKEAKKKAAEEAGGDDPDGITDGAGDEEGEELPPMDEDAVGDEMDSDEATPAQAVENYSNSSATISGLVEDMAKAVVGGEELDDDDQKSLQDTLMWALVATREIVGNKKGLDALVSEANQLHKKLSD